MNAVVEHKPEKSAYERLPRRYRRLVDEYVNGATGSDAVRGAGCKSPHARNVAYRLLRRPEIKEAIAEREAWAVQESGVRHVRTLKEMQAIAFADPRLLVNPETGKALQLKDLPADIAAAISSVEVEEISIGGETGTRYKYRFWDKGKALDKLGQYLKLWDAKGPTVNVDARSVTNNNLNVTDPAGQAALRAVAELGQRIAAITADSGAPTAGENGPLLPAAIRNGQEGRGESLAVAADQGGSEQP